MCNLSCYYAEDCTLKGGSAGPFCCADHTNVQPTGPPWCAARQPVLSMIRCPDHDTTGFCNSEPDPNRTGFRKKLNRIRYGYPNHRRARIRVGSDWIRTETNFGRIRTGSDSNFFHNWGIRTGSDWEDVCYFNVIILKISKKLVVIRFHRFAKW